MPLEWKFNISPTPTDTCLSSFFSALSGECFLPCLFDWFSCGVIFRIYKFTAELGWLRAPGGACCWGWGNWDVLRSCCLVFLQVSQLHRTRSYSQCQSQPLTCSSSSGWSTANIVTACNLHSFTSCTALSKFKSPFFIDICSPGGLD